MAITKRDLESEVARMNAKYCKNTKNRLQVGGAYGGYKVVLTGKPYKNGKGYRGIGTGNADITYGYRSAKDTLADLYKADGRGNVKQKINHFEKSRY